MQTKANTITASTIHDWRCRTTDRLFSKYHTTTMAVLIKYK